MSATSAKRSAKVISGERLADAGMALGNLVGEFGWIVNVSKLDTLTHADLEWIEGNTSMAEDLVCPDNVWRIIDIPREVYSPGFATMNDALALASAVVMSRQDFVDAAAELQLGRMLKTIPENGIVTPFGDVFCQMEPFAVWFGRKAGRVPALHDEAGLQAIARLFAGGAKDSRPETQLVEKTERPADAKRAGKAASKAAELEARAVKAESQAGTTTPRADAQRLAIVAIDEIESDPENDRKIFDKAELQELADSIKQHGILQPILLRSDPDRVGYGYLIVAGERRWRAAKMAGLKEVPAQITDRDGLQVSLARLDENLKRVDLSPIEKAQALKRLMDAHGLTQKEVGEAVGVQQGQVSNMLRLLNLPESLKKLVADGKIAPTFIRAILPYCDLPAVMDDVAKIFVRRLEKPDAEDERIEMRDVEQWIRNAVVNHSRPMTFQSHWSEYSNPSPKDRHFSKVSDENLKLLAPRKIDVMNEWEGKERTFNVKLFDELNKTPLANRREKHKAYKAKRDQSSGPTKAGGKTEKPFEHEWKVEQLLESQMSKLLADAIEATKPSSNRQKLHAVMLALAISSGESIIDEIAGHKTDWRKRIAQAAKKLDCPPAECDRFLQAIVVKDLRIDGHLDCSIAIELAKMLGVDLVAAWAPNDELRNCLTEHGRRLLAEAEPGVPDFLLPFFGIEKKAAKAKKGRAA
jgi:ParB/RepB/Spo0J family partition protein